MSSYQFTPWAVEDRFEIWSYIAADNLEAASRVEEAIYAACGFLADTPLAGEFVKT
jgi:plasmid stabilization system protein ParE